METKKCCNEETPNSLDDFEEIRIKKTKKSCYLCEDYSSNKIRHENLIAVLSCEGACLRGEVSRRIANELCFREFPHNTARICLGSALTKDTGQRNMVKKAKRVISLEGCLIECASRTIKAVVPVVIPEIIITDRLFNFDKNLFGINEVSEAELNKFTKEAVEKIKNII